MIPNPSMYLSNPFLNVAIESHSTTSCGRPFQNLTTLLLNACFLLNFLIMPPGHLSMLYYEKFIGLCIINRCKYFVGLYHVPSETSPFYRKHSYCLLYTSPSPR